MFGPLGFPEMMIILVVALIVFGPRKLPELGRSLGKSLSEFKRASNELRNTLDEEIRLEDRKAATPPASLSPTQQAVEAARQEPPPTGEPETIARGEHGA